jgi:glycosyltransferase involved in cell wall biosynthesis
MKVLMCIRNGYLNSFAGDSVQLMKTVEYLKKYNIDVDINSGSVYDFSSYDIIHLFNLTVLGETYQYYKRAMAYKKPVVISPIYWNLSRYYNFIKDDYELMLWQKWKHYRKEVLNGCRMIYPNSFLEMEEIKREFGSELPCEIIYNGIEQMSEDDTILEKINKYNHKDYILCAARVCKRKNQLLLAKACNKLQIPLVLIGNVNDKYYLNSCLRYRNVSYLGFIDSKYIKAFYSHAKVHALPSFVETPGLSSLEAAVSGCNIISTDEGSAKEYFKDMAIYCSPYNEESIFKSVESSLKQGNNISLKSHILKNYHWENCIKPLYESYKRILK